MALLSGIPIARFIKLLPSVRLSNSVEIGKDYILLLETLPRNVSGPRPKLGNRRAGLWGRWTHLSEEAGKHSTAQCLPNRLIVRITGGAC